MNQLNNTKQQLKKNLEEFDEKYGSFELCEVVRQKDYNNLKSFLSSSQSALLQALIKDIKEIDDSGGGRRIKTQLVSALKKIIK